MGLGIGKRDRMLLRADKVWRSIWHRQMLFASQNGEAIDNRIGPSSYKVTNKSNPTDGRSITTNNGE
jgi:hypothetical protein